MLALYLAWRAFGLTRRVLVAGVITGLLAALACGQLGRIARIIHAPGLASEVVTVRHDVQTGLEHALRSPPISSATGKHRP
jgi:hypothetical protein